MICRLSRTGPPNAEAWRHWPGFLTDRPCALSSWRRGSCACGELGRVHRDVHDRTHVHVCDHGHRTYALAHQSLAADSREICENRGLGANVREKRWLASSHGTTDAGSVGAKFAAPAALACSHGSTDAGSVGREYARPHKVGRRTVRVPDATKELEIRPDGEYHQYTRLVTRRRTAGGASTGAMVLRWPMSD